MSLFQPTRQHGQLRPFESSRHGSRLWMRWSAPCRRLAQPTFHVPATSTYARLENAHCAAKGAGFGHRVEFGYSFGRHSSDARGILRIPVDFGILLVAAKLQCIEYRVLLATAVGEVGGGGVAFELRNMNTQGGSVQGAGRVYVFPGLLPLRLAHNLLK
ncbi:hypothetical protein [Streptomyces sp. NPDC056549]|uniref:hypothetical protein n=1 Tax=Streptomyces sp. NPDC056549 TaxID=3345864 RepID=UPI00369584CA